MPLVDIYGITRYSVCKQVKTIRREEEYHEESEAHRAAEEGHRPAEQAAQRDSGKPDLLCGRHDRGTADSFPSADGVMGSRYGRM